MCDCYGEPCKVCGELFPLHLEDFSTGRYEVILVCDACIKQRLMSGDFHGETDFYKFLETNPYVEWAYRQEDKRGRPNKIFRLYALTQNAWDHHQGNSPNADQRMIKVRDIDGWVPNVFHAVVEAPKRCIPEACGASPKGRRCTHYYVKDKVGMCR